MSRRLPSRIRRRQTEDDYVHRYGYRTAPMPIYVTYSSNPVYVLVSRTGTVWFSTSAGV